MPTKFLPIGDLRGGRNGADPPISLPDNQCVEALNVDWYDGLIGRKRGGAAAVTETGGTAFSSGIQAIFRHVPGVAETAAEFWAVDGAATPIVKRMAGGTSFANVTLADAIATKPQEVNKATLNGKLFLAYDTTVDRLHVYDPNLGTPSVRRVGFATPAAPTVANSAGAGALAANKRYVRVRWGQFTATTAGTVYRRSEAGASVDFTPDGAHDNVVVTQPAVPGEGETHWEVELSSDNATWYRVVGQDVDTSIAGAVAVAIATTTTTVGGVWTSTYVNCTVPEPSGYYSRFPSVKYLVTDGNRLLGAGAWETSGADSGGKNSRIWYTPVLGSADKGDDERVPNQSNQKNYVDLNENDGGGITSLSPPINGVPYAFKYRQTWKLSPTGDVATPYLPRKISDAYGSIAHKAVCVGRDHIGNPAVYFLSQDGPCRIVVMNGVPQIQYLGRDIEDIWSGLNRAATTVVAHGLYHADKHQVWWWIATGSSNTPDTKIVFDVLLGKFTEGERIRGGWSKHTGNSAGATCSCLMSNTLAASMSSDLKPYIGRSSGTVIWKCDTSDTDDGGTAFQAYVKTKPIPVAPLGMNVGVGQTHLLAKVAAAVTITQTIDRDYGLETRTSTVLLTASASETRTVKKFEGSEMEGAGTLQFQWGDASATANAWTLDAAMLPVHTDERR